MLGTAFTQLYSPQQMRQFVAVRDALVENPKALDNRGDAADSVAALTTSHDGNDNGHS